MRRALQSATGTCVVTACFMLGFSGPLRAGSAVPDTSVDQPPAPARVSLPSMGVSFAAPERIEVVSVNATGLRWRVRSVWHGQDETDLVFAVDPSLASCQAWEAAWRVRLQPGTPEFSSRLNLYKTPPFIDGRWYGQAVFNRTGVMLGGDPAPLIWELCIQRPAGGVLTVRTAGPVRNVALLLHGPTREIANGWFGAREDAPVEDLPWPASAVQQEKRCIEGKRALGAASASGEEDWMLAMQRPEIETNCLWSSETRDDAQACRFGDAFSCSSLGYTAVKDSDFKAAAVLLQRACDLSADPEVCRNAQDAKAKAR